jgi:glycosyltransferase involved in cell wall biosynthesis
LQREVNLQRDLAALFTLYRLLRREQPHVVHTHAAKAGLFGRLAARLAGVPVVLHTLHGHVFSGEYFGKWKARLFLMLERMGTALSDRVLTVSEQVRRDIAAHGAAPLGRVDVVPLGLELDALTTGGGAGDAGRRFRQSLGLGPEANVYVAVGRLAQVKNGALFLKAAARVAQRDAAARFVFVGDGPRRAVLERQTQRLGMGDRVTFTGWWSDVGAVYAGADAVVLSSKNEGTPTSIIEAMACGCPVVATRVGGVPDVVDDGVTGRLVPPGDARALAVAMRDTFREAERTQRMVKKGHAVAFERYDAAQLVTRMDAFYRQRLRENDERVPPSQIVSASPHLAETIS